MSLSPDDERLYAAALSSLPHVGSRTLAALYAQYDSFQAIWRAPVEELQGRFRGTKPLWDALQTGRKTYDFDVLQQCLTTHAVHLVTCYDELYPALLKTTYNPPTVLWYRGTLPDTTKTAAIVGARKASPYGLNAAQTIAEELSHNGVTIISGGARGIDTKAHRGALRGRTPTSVVVAHGLDMTYPPENKRLFLEILDQGGAILSEYPFGTAPLATNFPARNRIIAGLSRCVIVVEAALKSGSLITADFALEEGRDVFAVPGSIFSSMSRGTNALLRKGAIALTQSEDVCTEYGWNGTTPQRQRPVLSLTLSESAVFDTLTADTPHTPDELIYLTELPPAQVSTILLQLELYGLIEEVRPGAYIKRTNL